MTRLAWAARDALVQDPDLLPLIGSGSIVGPWAFVDKPLARLENTGKVLLVLYENGVHTPSNPHNTMRFPRLFVDFWADATRNPDRSVKFYDADDKIERVLEVVKRHLHTPNLSADGGLTRVWGTEQQIQDRTGVPILGSQLMFGPEFSDVADAEGARMGQTWFGVNTV